MNDRLKIALYLETNIRFEPMRMSIWIVVGDDDVNEPIDSMKNAKRLTGPVEEALCMATYAAVKVALTACGIRYTERSVIDD